MSNEGAQHNPMDFLSQFTAKSASTGNLLYLSIGIFSLSTFLKKKDNEGIGVFIITSVGILLLIYNIASSLKSIHEFRKYLNYFRKVQDQFDPVYSIFIPNWTQLIYYQYTIVAFVAFIGIAMLIWRAKSLYKKT